MTETDQAIEQPMQGSGLDTAAAILTRLIPPDQWEVYAEVFSEAAKHGLHVAIGGGLAFSAYTGCMRNTKDMDVFVLEEESKDFIEITRQPPLKQRSAVRIRRLSVARCCGNLISQHAF